MFDFLLVYHEVRFVCLWVVNKRSANHVQRQDDPNKKSLSEQPAFLFKISQHFYVLLTIADGVLLTLVAKNATIRSTKTRSKKN